MHVALRKNALQHRALQRVPSKEAGRCKCAHHFNTIWGGVDTLAAGAAAVCSRH